MGQYFKIVNPAKRQYIDAIRFNEDVKASGVLSGYHATAVALLVLCVPVYPRRPSLIPYAAKIPLQSLTPGVYLLEVTATDNVSKVTATRQIDFIIE